MGWPLPSGTGRLSGVLDALLDLVLPADCAGCRLRAGFPLCTRCAAALARARPVAVRPDPAPAGLPRCQAMGAYQGMLRDLVISYKERGRRGLAEPLGERLAVAVSAAVPGDRPLILVPVPATARAARERRGDHMLRLSRVAARRLVTEGRPAVVLRGLRAHRRPDSAGLTAAQRARTARAAFSVRRGFRAAVESRVPGASAAVVVDDVMTTGATAAAACDVLASAGLRAEAVAVLAATQRRHPPSAVTGRRPHVPDTRTGGDGTASAD